jgi:hypothetical protein
LFIRAHLPKADGADARIGRMRLDSMSARSKSVNVLPGPAGDSIFGAPAAPGVTQKPTLLTNQTLSSKFFFHESAH